MPEISNDQLNAIGEQADTIDNLISALMMPFADSTHLAGIRGSLPGISKELKRVVVEVSGENPWD